MDPIYSTDDYPRVGCVASVDVTPNGYGLRISDPAGRVFESYACVKTPGAIARMVREWCEGKVPRLRAREDQP